MCLILIIIYRTIYTRIAVFCICDRIIYKSRGSFKHLQQALLIQQSCWTFCLEIFAIGTLCTVTFERYISSCNISIGGRFVRRNTFSGVNFWDHFDQVPFCTGNLCQTHFVRSLRLQQGTAVIATYRA